MIDAQAKLVIDALGGTSQTAKLMGAPISTVHSWRSSGIPPARLEHIKLIAKYKGVKLPALDQIEAQRKEQR